jgi:hypothetical protein
MRQCGASRRLDFSFLRGLTTIIFCAGAATDYELKKHRKEKNLGRGCATILMQLCISLPDLLFGGT